MTIDIPVSEIDELIACEFANPEWPAIRACLVELLRLRTAQPKPFVVADETFLANVNVMYPYVNPFVMEVLPSAQPKGESGVTLDQCANWFVREVGETVAMDEQDCVMYDAILAHLRSPAACAASQETDEEIKTARNVVSRDMREWRCLSATCGYDPVNVKWYCDTPACAVCGHAVELKAALRLDESKAQMTEADAQAVRWALLRLSPNWPREGEKHLETLRSLAKRLGEK